jgi:hypothetical protein
MIYIILRGNINKSCLLKKLTVLLTKAYSLDKEQTRYDDLLDALTLSLKGYNIS